jgi:RHS repeat-associated protein
VDYGYDGKGQLVKAIGREINSTNRLQEQLGYAYDASGNLQYRTNHTLIQQFNVNGLNQIMTLPRSGAYTVVAGSVTRPATNVTVSGTGVVTGPAELYADLSWAKGGVTNLSGTNTYTAVALDSYGRSDTNVSTVVLPIQPRYNYDLNGNLVLEDSATYGTNRVFAYDDENQLISVAVANQWKTEFSYDGKMRLRVRKEYTWGGSWVLASETRYVYDGMLAIQERDASNTPQVTYTRGRDLSGTFEGAGGIGGLLARTDATQSAQLLKTAYYHADGNGNITALLSTNGLIIAHYQYDPYGRLLAQSGPLSEANRYRFSSKEWQANTGLYYYGYRFYEPETQRWVNRDPIGENGGNNLYGFVGNRPSTAIDPFGMEEFESQWPDDDLIKTGNEISKGSPAGVCGRGAICLHALRICVEGCESEYGLAAPDEKPRANKACKADCAAKYAICLGKSFKGSKKDGKPPEPPKDFPKPK